MIFKTTETTFPLGRSILHNRKYVTIVKSEKKEKTVHSKMPRYVCFPNEFFWWSPENAKYYEEYYSYWKLKDSYLYDKENRPTYEYTFSCSLYTVQLTADGEELLQKKINALAKRMAKLTRFLG